MKVYDAEVFSRIRRAARVPPEAAAPFGRRDPAGSANHLGAISARAAVGHDFSAMPVLQRQFEQEAPDPYDNPKRHPKGAPKAKTCKGDCSSAEFCKPYESESFARHQLSKVRNQLIAGIALFTGSAKVGGMWVDHLDGGSTEQDRTGDFAADFTSSPTTKDATDYLSLELESALETSPPAFGTSDKVTIDIKKTIPQAIKNLGKTKKNDTEKRRMNFDYPRDIPGNIAGDIGDDQTTCPAGAKPSPFNDQRDASGTAVITRDGKGTLTVEPKITFTVKDTLDLCPGNCGESYEQIATIPISQFEATGISGDVPFKVLFPAPTRSFIVAPKPKMPAKPPAKK
jgi:hypothetical protein